MLNLFFFFQAEDGIRDDLVTGVQTCALPICRLLRPRAEEPVHGGRLAGADRGRSEERRVGKECRSRGSPDNLKKKNEEIIVGRRMDLTCDLVGMSTVQTNEHTAHDARLLRNI